MVRLWPLAIATVLMIPSVFALGMTNVQGTEEDYWPIQSSWTYMCNESYDDGSMRFSADGSLRNTCDRRTEITIDDESHDVVCFRSYLLSNIDGYTKQTTWTGGFIWIYIWGTYKVETVEYYDAESGTILRTATNETLDIKGGEYPNTYSVVYYREQNETNYIKVVSDPAGFDLAEEWPDLAPGTTWNTEYTTHSEVLGVTGTTPFEKTWDLKETITYNYLGSETLTTPAGTHECAEVQHLSNGYNTTRWYCPEIMADTKITTIHSDGEVVWTLQSYEPGDTDDGSLGDGDTAMILALAIVVPAAAVVAAVAMFMWVRRRGSKKAPPPQTEGEVG